MVNSARAEFTGDNRWLVTGTGEEYRFWQVGSWKPAHTVRRSGSVGVYGMIGCSFDGRMIAVTDSRDSVRLLEPSTGRELATLEAAYPVMPTWLRFSPDGGRMAAVSTQHVIHLWDLRSIRQQLAAMKLDWDLPPLPPPATNQFQEPLTVIVLGNTNQPGTERKP